MSTLSHSEHVPPFVLSRFDASSETWDKSLETGDDRIESIEEE